MFQTIQNKAILAILAIAVAVSLAVLVWGLNLPLTEQHGFRQTQTAISVYWMIRGGPWLDYWTPVLGVPWSIPFEFPLYQWIVAALVNATGMGIDPAGRLVSYFWLIFSLWPASYLFRSYRFPSETPFIYAILLLASPIYLFWGRSFLIETQALALCFAMIALMRAWLLNPRIVLLLLALIAGVAGALTKITTLIPFLLLGFAMMVEQLLAERGNMRQQLVVLLGSGLIVMPGLVLAVMWNGHADAVKALNPVAAFALSDNLVEWNFGTLDQRFSLPMLGTLLRAIVDVAGRLGPVIFALSILALTRWKFLDRQMSIIVGIIYLAWILPFFVLSNLHIVHNYYQTANAALLIAALAPIYAASVKRLPAILFITLLVATVASQYVRFGIGFLPSMVHAERHTHYAIGRYLQQATDADSAIVGVGIEWSPVVPYYAERRGLLLAGLLPDVDSAALDNLGARLDGQNVGAVVVCPSPMLDNAEFAAKIAALHAGFAEKTIQRCTVYTALQNTPMLKD